MGYHQPIVIRYAPIGAQEKVNICRPPSQSANSEILGLTASGF
jgi:hypothetical protein